MTFNEFFSQFEDYRPRIAEEFENQWDMYLSRNAHTYVIAFEGQSDHDVGIQITCDSVDGDILESDIIFADCTVTYVRDDIMQEYLEECKIRNIDPRGTRNRFQIGDYVPNVFLDEYSFLRAVKSYADICDINPTPPYLSELDKPAESTVWQWSPADHEEPEHKKYRVFFDVRLDYTIENAQSMDDALAQASEALYNDLDFMFDDDAIIVHKRTVSETVNGDNHD